MENVTLSEAERKMLVRALFIYAQEWKLANANVTGVEQVTSENQIKKAEALAEQCRTCTSVELKFAETIAYNEPEPERFVEAPKKKEHPPLTEDQKLAIFTALEFMCSFDGDHAQELNGIGFNKHDTTIGHSLYKGYTTYGHLTDKQHKLAIVILKKYKRQIPEDIYTRIYPQPTDKDLAAKAFE